MPMNVEVAPAAESDKEVLRRLMQLYQYDFSEMEGHDVDCHGIFDYRWLDNYWTEEGRYPFLIKVDGKWAGFAFVNEHTYVTLTPAKSIAEFFVMRKYRRRGVGRFVATELFRMFPGRWEVSETADNQEAQAFWRSVIGTVADGSYREVELSDERWTGPVQVFEIRQEG